MTYGTDAIAHDSLGKTVFVSGAAPGDVVEAVITSDGTRFSRARTTKIIESGADRIDTHCPQASLCGGCPWAHLTRSAQLTAKRNAIIDALTRIGSMDTHQADELVETCLDPGPPLGYRNKIELGFMRTKGRARVGLHALGDAELIKTDSCPLLDAHDPKLVKAISGAVCYLANSSGIDLIRIGIRSSSRTNDLEIALWSTPGPFPRSKAAKIIGDATRGRATSIVRVLAKGPVKARRVIGVERLGGKGFWEERVGSERMRISAPSFFQVNTAGAEALVKLVMDGLSPTSDELAMDLYAGAGTFTLPLARHCAWVDAVEAYGPAVRDLRRNLDATSLENAEPTGGDAYREFPDTEADVIVVDPPRSGLAEGVIDRLSALNARTIAYVSCDPATLARDLARFSERGRYSPSRITPVDLFPQTYHVETVVLMSKVK